MQIKNKFLFTPKPRLSLRTSPNYKPPRASQIQDQIKRFDFSQATHYGLKTAVALGITKKQLLDTLNSPHDTQLLLGFDLDASSKENFKQYVAQNYDKTYRYQAQLYKRADLLDPKILSQKKLPLSYQEVNKFSQLARSISKGSSPETTLYNLYKPPTPKTETAQTTALPPEEKIVSTTTASTQKRLDLEKKPAPPTSPTSKPPSRRLPLSFQTEEYTAPPPDYPRLGDDDSDEGIASIARYDYSKEVSSPESEKKPFSPAEEIRQKSAPSPPPPPSPSAPKEEVTLPSQKQEENVPITPSLNQKFPTIIPIPAKRTDQTDDKNQKLLVSPLDQENKEITRAQELKDFFAQERGEDRIPLIEKIKESYRVETDNKSLIRDKYLFHRLDDEDYRDDGDWNEKMASFNQYQIQSGADNQDLSISTSPTTAQIEAEMPTTINDDLAVDSSPLTKASQMTDLSRSLHSAGPKFQAPSVNIDSAQTTASDPISTSQKLNLAKPSFLKNFSLKSLGKNLFSSSTKKRLGSRIVDVSHKAYKTFKRVAQIIPWVVKMVALIIKALIATIKALIYASILLVKLFLAGGWVLVAVIGGYFLLGWITDKIVGLFSSSDDVYVAYQATIEGEIATDSAEEDDPNKCLKITKTASPAEFADNNDGNKKTHFSFSITPKGDSKATLTGRCQDTVKTECNEGSCPQPDPSDLTTQVCNALKKALGVESLIDVEITSAISFDLREDFPDGYPLPKGNNYGLDNIFTLGFKCTNEEDESKNKSYNDEAIATVIVGEFAEELCWPTSGTATQLPYGTYSHQSADAIDIANSVGTPIVAPFTGTYRYSFGGNGGCCASGTYRARNGSSYTILFCHMTRETCNRGSSRSLKRGEEIGKMGATGRVTGPHLHLAVRPGNKAHPNIYQLFNKGRPVKKDSYINQNCR